MDCFTSVSLSFMGMKVKPPTTYQMLVVAIVDAFVRKKMPMMDHDKTKTVGALISF